MDIFKFVFPDKDSAYITIVLFSSVSSSSKNNMNKHLWFFGKQIEIENGTKLLVIDCEGLDVKKEGTNNIDMNRFTLSVLLSRCLIYNTKYAISENKIEEFSNVPNLSINISKNKNNNLDFGYKL